MNTKHIGDYGENAAQEYLENKGYEILKRNFRLKCGEIDIIAEDNGCIVFVEVKTRKSNLFGEPGEYVDRRKQERVKKAAGCFTDIVNNDVRFDVVEVLYIEKSGKMTVTGINHIENAF